MKKIKFINAELPTCDFGYLPFLSICLSIPISVKDIIVLLVPAKFSVDFVFVVYSYRFYDGGHTIYPIGMIYRHELPSIHEIGPAIFDPLPLVGCGRFQEHRIIFTFLERFEQAGKTKNKRDDHNVIAHNVYEKYLSSHKFVEADYAGHKMLAWSTEEAIGDN